MFHYFYPLNLPLPPSLSDNLAGNVIILSHCMFKDWWCNRRLWDIFIVAGMLLQLTIL